MDDEHISGRVPVTTRAELERYIQTLDEYIAVRRPRLAEWDVFLATNSAYLQRGDLRDDDRATARQNQANAIQRIAQIRANIAQAETWRAETLQRIAAFQPGVPPVTAPVAAGVPTWLWAVGGLALVGGIVWFVAKKARGKR